MRLFGFEITRAQGAQAKGMSAVEADRGWFSIFGNVKEAWGGAWQADVEQDSPRDVLTFSAVFSCVTGIASDISKLRPRIVEEDRDGICEEVPRTDPRMAVLRKPNHYQTRIKFIEQWLVSKLLHGNAYALKRRDGRGVVVGLYLLDPQRVTPLVADSGDVYYKLSSDNLSALLEGITVPASEIIHDTMVSLWRAWQGACGSDALARGPSPGRRDAPSRQFAVPPVWPSVTPVRRTQCGDRRRRMTWPRG